MNTEPPRKSADNLLMAITASDIQTRIEDGVESLDSADYATALIKFEAAAALMAGVPEFKALENEVAWKPEQLDAVIERVRRLARKSASGAGKIIKQPIHRDITGWTATA